MRTSIYMEAYFPRRLSRGEMALLRSESSGLGSVGLDHWKSFLAVRRQLRRIDIRRDYGELQRLNRVPVEEMSTADWKAADDAARRVDIFLQANNQLNDSFFAVRAIIFACARLDREEILRVLQEEPWFVKHEILARWGWLDAHQLLTSRNLRLDQPFSFRVASRGRAGRRVDREFYQLLTFVNGLRAATGEELLFVEKGETPDFRLETTAGLPVGVEVTEAPVSWEWAAERDAEEEFLKMAWSVLGQRGIHLHILEPPSWRILETRLPEAEAWLLDTLAQWETHREPTRLSSAALELSIEPSSWPHPAITVSDERGLTGDDIQAGTLQLEESIASAITGKLQRPDGRARKRPEVRPCHLVIYPNHDFGQDLDDVIGHSTWLPILTASGCPTNSESYNSYDALSEMFSRYAIGPVQFARVPLPREYRPRDQPRIRPAGGQAQP